MTVLLFLFKLYFFLFACFYLSDEGLSPCRTVILVTIVSLWSYFLKPNHTPCFHTTYTILEHAHQQLQQKDAHSTYLYPHIFRYSMNMNVALLETPQIPKKCHHVARVSTTAKLLTNPNLLSTSSSEKNNTIRALKQGVIPRCKHEVVKL